MIVFLTRISSLAVVDLSYSGWYVCDLGGLSSASFFLETFVCTRSLLYLSFRSSYQKKIAAERQSTAAAFPVALSRLRSEGTEKPLIEHHGSGLNWPCSQGDLHSWFLACLSAEDEVDGKIISNRSSSSSCANQLAAQAYRLSSCIKETGNEQPP